MFKIFVGAKYRVDFVIIAGVVVVIAFGLEDGIKVNRFNAQLFKIIQFFLDAAQVAAEKVVGNNFIAVGVLEINGVIFPTRVENCAFLFDNFVTVAIKSVRENLIHDGMFKPIGSFRAPLINRNLEGGRNMIVKFANAA